jgi:hypothetical protein
MDQKVHVKVRRGYAKVSIYPAESKSSTLQHPTILCRAWVGPTSGMEAGSEANRMHGLLSFLTGTSAFYKLSLNINQVDYPQRSGLLALGDGVYRFLLAVMQYSRHAET